MFVRHQGAGRCVGANAVIAFVAVAGAFVAGTGVWAIAEQLQQPVMLRVGRTMVVTLVKGEGQLWQGAAA